MRGVIALTLAALLAGCSGSVSGPSPIPEPLPTGVFAIRSASAPVQFAVEIAETSETRQRGLMGRTFLPDDEGMVFLFDEPTATVFWMKDTVIPLSIAFWDTGGRIIDILDMVPCGTEECPYYRASGEYVGAVEVNRGAFEQHGVRVGDLVELDR